MEVVFQRSRSLPFFKNKLRAVLSESLGSLTLQEIAMKLPVLFQPEITNIFSASETLKNLRGKPAVKEGTETGREILLAIFGTAPNRLTLEGVSFEATVETKFKKFLEGAITYSLFTNIPEELGLSDLNALIEAPATKLEKIEVGIDIFRTRQFSFLNIHLQEHIERFSVSFSVDPNSRKLLLSGEIENYNLQNNPGFSEQIITKIDSLEIISGLTGLTEYFRRQSVA